jgi:hypothetical protein
VGRLQEEKKTHSPAVAVVAKPIIESAPVTPVLRKGNTLHYLLAAMSVTKSDVQVILEREVFEIAGKEAVEQEKTVAGAAIAKLAFQIEEFIDKNSSRLQIEEWVYKLNQLKELTIKEKVTAARTELGEMAASGAGDTAAIIERVHLLQKELQVPAYTPDLFTVK